MKEISFSCELRKVFCKHLYLYVLFLLLLFLHILLLSLQHIKSACAHVLCENKDVVNPPQQIMLVKHVCPQDAKHQRSIN